MARYALSLVNPLQGCVRFNLKQLYDMEKI